MNNPHLELTDELNRERRPDVQREIERQPLLDAHRVVTSRAEGVLPFEPGRGATP